MNGGFSWTQFKVSVTLRPRLLRVTAPAQSRPLTWAAGLYYPAPLLGPDLVTSPLGLGRLGFPPRPGHVPVTPMLFCHDPPIDSEWVAPRS